MHIELTVKVTKQQFLGTAKIERFYTDIPGGVRLDKPLGGLVSWNLDALTIVKQDIKEIK